MILIDRLKIYYYSIFYSTKKIHSYIIKDPKHFILNRNLRYIQYNRYNIIKIITTGDIEVDINFIIVQ